MAGTVAEVVQIISEADYLAKEISNMYVSHNASRDVWKAEKRELRDYIFATDTTKTTNRKLPWKNKTTYPKICQIRDLLHANYLYALHPNDSWLRWEAYTTDSNIKKKRDAIEAYMSNKLRQSGFYSTLSQLLYDYIDYGNCFASAIYVREYTTDSITGELIPKYIGPRAIRVSPYDIEFNPTASNFESSYKITRSLKSIGELQIEAEQQPDLQYDLQSIDMINVRRAKLSTFNASDVDKAAGFSVDGFGAYSNYINSQYVEILEFQGDIRDENGNFFRNQIITIADRCKVIRRVDNPSWIGESNLVHGVWRRRPDNLWGMGPLDNLVGMQYRIDHLENIKADLFDLIAHPPIKVKGNVEEFDWEPFAQIFCGDDGDLEILKVDATALQADTQIAILESRMEQAAGAPRQAIGQRTPGEKTAFEVQTLENNSNKMFQEKIQAFEIEVLEPLLNKMLELARRNLDGSDVVGVLDTSFGVESFITITKEDLKAKGKLRPIGARHFLARAQTIQNYQGMRSIVGADPTVMNHISGIKEAEMLEDLLGFHKYELVRPNVRIQEQMETQRITSEMQNMLQQEAMTPTQNEIPL